jgi:hypothetical protein
MALRSSGVVAPVWGVPGFSRLRRPWRDDLQNRLDALKRKYRAALAYIRHVLGSHPCTGKTPSTKNKADL